MYNSGRRGKRTSDGYGVISTADNFNQNEYPIPTVTSFSVTDGSYNPLPDTAVDTAGGQTIVINGSGFRPGATVMVGGTTIGAVTYLDQGRLAFTAPSLSSASYTIFVINSNGGTGILLPGLVYSGLPTWATSAGSIGSVYETKPISQSFAATGDAPLTYALYSGSLPSGASLASDGTLSGTAPADSGSTTYSFTIRAYDAQNQHSDRSFSLTINTDVVTWSTPSDNQVITSYEYAPITNVTASATSAAGYGVLYTANATPTGITIDANTGLISGTANTVGNTYTLLAATANTTVRNATRNVIFNVNQDVVTWSSPADATEYTLTGGSTMANVTLAATSAAGRSITYTANALPSGVGLSGNTIYGTPDSAQTVTTLLTATADTTNRSATRTISWTISLGDLYWKNTSLLLNGVTSANTFINDSSLNNYDLKIVGDTKPNNLNPFQEGYYSNYFDGTGDYISFATSTAFGFGTADFTVEAWVNKLGTQGLRNQGTLFDFRPATTITSNTPAVYVKTDGTVFFYFAGAIRITSSAGVVTNGVWSHIALVKSSGTFYLYVNGVSVGSYVSAADNGTTNVFKVGYQNADANPDNLYAYVSNLRVVKGTALYTTTFTPSTSPFTTTSQGATIASTSLLTCQSYTLLDRSVNNHTITKGGDTTITAVHPFDTPTTATYNTSYSVEMKGSGNYVSVPGGNSGFAFGTGDLTIEGWVYWKSGTAFTLFDNRSTTTSVNIAILLNGTSIGVYIGGSSFVINGSTFTTGQWYHIALVRISGEMKLYVNGTQSGSTYTSTQDFTAVSAQACIGGGYPNGTNSPLVGYISNVRVVKGLGVYTGNFTVPTSPLTATQSSGTNISAITAGQTVLLTCQDSKGIDNSSSAQTVNINGTAQPITVSPFTMTSSNVSLTGIGSTYFDGTGDYLLVPDSDSWVFNGDYTVEAWVYPTVLNAESMIFSVWYGGTSAQTSFVLEYLSSGRLKSIFTVGSGQVAVTGTTRLVVVNQWNHLAVTRTGSTIRLFVNGIMDTTTGTSSGTNNNLTHQPSIGSNNNQGTYGAFLTGYITNLRVVKGTSLYSSNFLPPQVPLTSVANTQLLTLQTTGGGNNNAIVDQSRFNNIITRAGNTTQGTFSPYSQNGWSTYLSGADIYPPQSSNFSFAGNFTVEFWINLQTTSNTSPSYIFMQISTSFFAINMQAGSYVSAFLNSSSASLTCTDVYPTLGKWAHIALVRNGSTVKIYVNGVASATTATNSSTLGASNQTFYISNGGAPAAYMSNVRVVNGTAVYTSNFTPSTTPLTSIANTVLLTCQSNRFIDNSPNNYTIGRDGTPSVQAYSPFASVSYSPSVNGGSMYFDGTGDYVSVNNPSGIFNTTTDNWTIQGWFYWPNTGTTSPAVLAYGTDSAAAGKFAIYWASDNYFYLTDIVAVNAIFTNTTVMPINQWAHVAVVNNAGTLSAYMNGVLIASTTNNLTSTNITTLYQAAHLGNSWYSNIYFSDVSFTKGALYTGAFVPPAAPTTAITTIGANTYHSSLYLTGTSGGIVDAHGTNNLETVGDVRLASITPYTGNTGGKSIYFDGNGDYLYQPNTLNYQFGVGDYTVEYWVNPTNFAALGVHVDFRTVNGATGGAIQIYATTGGVITVYGGSSTATLLITGGAITSGAWTHIALVRQSGVGTTLYINGLRSGAVASDSTSYGLGALWVGTGAGAGNNYLLGYIEDLRITKGVARYTANTTTSSTPFQDK